MTEQVHHADVVIAGAGLAGLVAAHELLDHGKTVLLLDKDVPGNLGGLAKESFGGVHLIGTPQQKRTGIADSPELALRDWLSYARFGEGDSWRRGGQEQPEWQEHRLHQRFAETEAVGAEGCRVMRPVVAQVQRSAEEIDKSMRIFDVCWNESNSSPGPMHITIILLA